MEDFFNLPCLNVIWQLVCGRRYEYDNQILAELIRQIEAFTMEKAIGPIAGVSYLKHVPPFKGIYNSIKST